MKQISQKALLFAIVVGLAGSSVSTIAQGADAKAGQALAEQNCARCHAIGTDDESKLPIAPPLRSLSSKYALDNLQEAFAEGIVTGHNEMPEFRLQPKQIDDLLAYIQSISP